MPPQDRRAHEANATLNTGPYPESTSSYTASVLWSFGRIEGPGACLSAFCQAIPEVAGFDQTGCQLTLKASVFPASTSNPLVSFSISSGIPPTLERNRGNPERHGVDDRGSQALGTRGCQSTSSPAMAGSISATNPAECAAIPPISRTRRRSAEQYDASRGRNRQEEGRLQ